MAKKPGMAGLRHQVVLCSQQDQIDAEGNMELNRSVAWRAWANIEPKRAQTFSANGASFHAGSRGVRSHVIMIRYNWTLNISTYAWVFEKRLKSPPRWFKILSVSQTEDCNSQYFQFDVRIIEQSDEVIEPVEPMEPCDSPAKKLPPGVSL